MNQREFEKLVEETRIKALQQIEEGFMEWLGDRAFRGEEIQNGEEQSEANQAQGTEV